MRRESDLRFLSKVRPDSDSPSSLYLYKNFDINGITAYFLIIPDREAGSFEINNEINIHKHDILYSIPWHYVSETLIASVQNIYSWICGLQKNIEKQFYFALFLDDLKKAEEAVELNSGVLPSFSGKRSLLHLAAHFGCLNMIGWLIEVHGSGVRIVDEYGNTPFHEAAKNKMIDAMLLLCKHDDGVVSCFQNNNAEQHTPLQILDELGMKNQFLILYQGYLEKNARYFTFSLIQSCAQSLQSFREKNLDLDLSSFLRIVLGYYLPTFSYRGFKSTEAIINWTLTAVNIYLKKLKFDYRNLYLDNFQNMEQIVFNDRSNRSFSRAMAGTLEELPPDILEFRKQRRLKRLKESHSEPTTPSLKTRLNPPSLDLPLNMSYSLSFSDSISGSTTDIFLPPSQDSSPSYSERLLVREYSSTSKQKTVSGSSEDKLSSTENIPKNDDEIRKKQTPILNEQSDQTSLVTHQSPTPTPSAYISQTFLGRPPSLPPGTMSPQVSPNQVTSQKTPSLNYSYKAND